MRGCLFPMYLKHSGTNHHSSEAGGHSISYWQDFPIAKCILVKKESQQAVGLGRDEWLGDRDRGWTEQTLKKPHLCWQRQSFLLQPCYLWGCQWSPFCLCKWPTLCLKKSQLSRALADTRRTLTTLYPIAFQGIHHSRVNKGKVDQNALCVVMVSQQSHKKPELWKVVAVKAVRDFQLWHEPGWLWVLLSAPSLNCKSLKQVQSPGHCSLLDSPSIMTALKPSPVQRWDRDKGKDTWASMCWERLGETVS